MLAGLIETTPPRRSADVASMAKIAAARAAAILIYALAAEEARRSIFLRRAGSQKSESHQKSCLPSLPVPWGLACVEIKILRHVLNHRVVLHAINATCSMAWRCGSSPLDRARTAAAAHPTHCLISTQGPARAPFYRLPLVVVWPGAAAAAASCLGAAAALASGCRLWAAASGVSPFGGGTGGFLPGGTGGFFWGGGGRGLASFFGGGGGRGGSLASPLGGGLDAAPVPGDGGASLAAASSFSPDHQLDQEPAAA